MKTNYKNKDQAAKNVYTALRSVRFRAKAFLLTGLLTIVSLQIASAQGNLVVNGGFDSNANGWQAFNISSGFGFDPYKGHPGGVFRIVASSPDKPAYIAQKILGLTPGTTYLVSGDYELTSGYASDIGFGVGLDKNMYYQGSASTWRSFSFLYTATSGFAYLNLYSRLNGTQTYYSVDNISMQAVPEPGSWCLLGMGALVFAGIKLRRNK